MKFSRYVKDKINYTLGFIVYCMIIIAYTGAMQIDKDVSIVIITIYLIFFVTGVIINYWKKNKYIKNIEKILCCRYWIKIYVIRKQINGCWAYIGKCYIFGINSKRI